jgi:hypothetical protein
MLRWLWNFAVCPTCHSRFTQNIVVLSLPIPVLKYINAYVEDTPLSEQQPLHEVRAVVRDVINIADVPRGRFFAF